jgi:cell wall-associated NlpC family hydrolase
VDCSGLVVGVYGTFGVVMPRAADEQARFGREVPRSELEPGDLVFFRTESAGAVSHVGIYAGGGQFIHASTRTRRVQFDRLDNRYFRRRYETARRVL